MRKRRQKNPLIARILVISILAHIIVLPILAKLGAFKKIQQHFMETQLVKLPTPPPIPEKQETKKAKKNVKKTAQQKKSSKSSSKASKAARKSNITQPKVVASSTSGTGDANGPTVDANGTGKTGEVPKLLPNGNGTGSGIVDTSTNTKPPVTNHPIETVHNPAPETHPTVTKTITPPPVKRPPVYTAAAATYSPQPTIPDDLRDQAIDRTCVCSVVVSPDGSPSAVSVSQSSGSDELDRIALETARRWKFKPATRDGEPVEGKARLHIEFKVE